MKKTKIIVIAVGILAIVGFGSLALVNKQNSTPVEETSQVRVIEYSGQDGKSVCDLLRETHQVEVTESSMGEMVKSIDGIASTDSEFWLYSVNGTPGEVSCDKYIKNVSEDGILLADSTNVLKIPSFSGKVYQHHITDDAIKVIGNKLVANIISLGIIVQLTDIVTKEAIKKALMNRIPVRVKELNIKALEHGFEVAKKL